MVMTSQRRVRPRWAGRSPGSGRVPAGPTCATRWGSAALGPVDELSAAPLRVVGDGVAPPTHHSTSAETSARLRGRQQEGITTVGTSGLSANMARQDDRRESDWTASAEMHNPCSSRSTHPAVGETRRDPGLSRRTDFTKFMFKYLSSLTR